MLIVLYVTVCLLVAFLGRNRGLGFLPTFLLSLLLTPLVTILVLLLTRGSAGTLPAKAHAATCFQCHNLHKRIGAIEYCTHCGAPL